MLNASVVRSGPNKGCINFGIVHPDSREARLYPVADELLASLQDLVGEIEKLQAPSPEAPGHLDAKIITRAQDLIKSILG